MFRSMIAGLIFTMVALPAQAEFSPREEAAYRAGLDYGYEKGIKDGGRVAMVMGYARAAVHVWFISCVREAALAGLPAGESPADEHIGDCVRDARLENNSRDLWPMSPLEDDSLWQVFQDQLDDQVENFRSAYPSQSR